MNVSFFSGTSMERIVKLFVDESAASSFLPEGENHFSIIVIFAANAVDHVVVDADIEVPLSVPF